MNMRIVPLTFGTPSVEGFAVLDGEGTEIARHKKLSMKVLRPVAKSWGLSITVTEGEYRINKTGGREVTAAYTNDALDAINTGIAMAEKGAW